MKINPILNSDFYKQLHHLMLCQSMTLLYSNITPRKSRLSEVDKMVFFGLQYFIKEYLIDQWNEMFFKLPIEVVIVEYVHFIGKTLGIKEVHIKHIEDLHELGYLPLEIKALPEGSQVNMRVPCLTIKNTHPEFGWLVNFLETCLSNVIWSPCTTATIAFEYRKLLNDFAKITGADENFVQFQAHDFAQRGYSSVETSMTSGAGHLLSFVGTDTIPAILFLQEYYGANIEKELIGTSVPATEHSVMCVNAAEIGELETFRELITKTFPSGIISIVSDTWDLWKVCTEYLVNLKDEVLARDGKVVIRPDSGDPADIICGNGRKEMSNHPGHPAYKGVIELLWDIFGGTVNKKGYKVLDPHIGAIYGDSITLERAKDILERLKAKGFSSSNIVFGVGSFTYQMNTRDTFGLAMKATYVEILQESDVLTMDEGDENNIDGDFHSELSYETVGFNIFKDPITDDGTKKSAKGLLRVEGKDGTYILHDQQTWDQEKEGALETVFKNGKLIKDQSLSEIRQRLWK